MSACGWGGGEVREFHSDKLVVEFGGGTEERKGVSWDVKVCFSRNEVKMEATADVQADFRQC